MNTRRFIDLSGKRFGRLFVVCRTENRGCNTRFLCECDCGKRRKVYSTALTRGLTRSCGCLRREVTSARCTTHGLTNAPIYAVWCAMLRRCRKTADSSFGNYGARGITVCRRWLSFHHFILDMGHPAQGMTLERKDNSVGYSPQNCIWANRTKQGRNKRNNHLVCDNGESLCISEWSERTGISESVISYRLKRGWSDHDAVTIRTGQKRK